MEPQGWGVSTQKEGQIYLHILSQETPEEIVLPGSKDWNVTGVVLFDGGKEIEFKKVGPDQDLTISLSKADRTPIDTIVVLER